MKKLISAFLFSTVIMIFTVSCGPDYNTDFEPPPPNAQLDEVFPGEINGMRKKVERLNLTHPVEGFTASYGDKEITIQAILTPNKSVADDYFKDVYVPRFDEMKNHFRGKINGRWRASGTDENGRKYFAWVNNAWIFAVSGTDKENFSSAIDAFNFVSK